MLNIIIPETEAYNEKLNQFQMLKSVSIRLEHSLVSVSKWESIWHVPFLNDDKKTYEQTISYIECMTISQNIERDVYKRLSKENINEIAKYIDDSKTATWFSNNSDQKKANNKREVITSELIYFWMITYGIPFECQKWHLNRLLTLIKICSIKNEPPKKMGKNEILSNNRKLNAARRKAMHTRG